MFYGITPLGIIHTAISLVAVGAGAIALIRDRKISWEGMLGKTYVISTIIVCLTGFGIFQHGGFGKPHALGVITLITLAVILVASKGKLGGLSAYVERVGYSLTFFFHIIPGVTETATRLPYGAPLAASPEDEGIKMVIGICFLLFLAGAILQVRGMRREVKSEK